MNVADVDDISSRLNAHGGLRVHRPEDADLILVNTCTVRQKAEDKAVSFLGGLKHLGSPNGLPANLSLNRVRNNDSAVAVLDNEGCSGSGADTDCGSEGGPSLVIRGGQVALRSLDKPYIVAMGCVIPKARKRLAGMFAHLDLMVNYSDPDIVFAELASSFPPLSGQALEESFTPLSDPNRSLQSFVTAIRGCNHRCSFCVVPWARGPQRDVSVEQIVREAQMHEEAGAPDLVVLGQSIMAYGKASGPDHPRFADMMCAVLDNTSFPWVGFLTSLACDFTDEIAERVIANPRITPLLHLPVQSGSDSVLETMLRKYDVETFKRAVKKAREVRPDLYLTTDLLVGFPTEEDDDFRRTMELVEEIGFDDAFMFAYSPRPGTHSVRTYEDRWSREEKIERLSLLIARQRELSSQRSRRYIGQVLDVIIEKKDNGEVVARTAFNKPVSLPSARAGVGAYTKALIKSVKVSAFEGEEVAD